MTSLDAYPGDIITVKEKPVTPPDPPPVEPPPGAIELKVGQLTQQRLTLAKDGDVFLLRGGEHDAPFLKSTRKITLQAFPGEVPVLTTSGRPDLLYLENDAILRGLTFLSQSTGFDDSQGAALSEVRGPTVPIGLVWYDGCTFIGTSKMATREQLLYIADKGKTISEVRVTGCTFDGKGTQGFGIHPYSGPSPKLVTVSGSTFRNFPRNAAVLNAANACLVRVDGCTFEATATYARGMYGPVEVSNSKRSGNSIGTVIDKGGNS